MPARKPRYMRVIYHDQDQRTCNVSGVITDDTAVTNRTIELQGSGRNINISTTTPEMDSGRVPSIDALLTGCLKGYRHDPDLSW